MKTLFCKLKEGTVSIGFKSLEISRLLDPLQAPQINILFFILFYAKSHFLPIQFLKRKQIAFSIMRNLLILLYYNSKDCKILIKYKSTTTLFIDQRNHWNKGPFIVGSLVRPAATIMSCLLWQQLLRCF